LTNIDFNIDQNSIDPRFFFRVDFEYYENLEIPLIFNGFIKTTDDKRIAKIDSEHDYIFIHHFNFQFISKLAIKTNSILITFCD
jgi:hypothetical protein